jgi:hypothetical protein
MQQHCMQHRRAQSTSQTDIQVTLRRFQPATLHAVAPILPINSMRHTKQHLQSPPPSRREAQSCTNAPSQDQSATTLKITRHQRLTGSNLVALNSSVVLSPGPAVLSHCCAALSQLPVAASACSGRHGCGHCLCARSGRTCGPCHRW